MTHRSFFEEIEEDLERQKMEAFWKRHAVSVVVMAVCVVLGTGGYTAWHSWHVQQQQKSTAELIEIVSHSQTETGKQIAALESFAEKHHGETQATLAQLHAAGTALKAGDDKKAVAIYDKIANDTKADPAFRQLADLRAVQAQMDSGDPVTLQKRLQPLLADNAPWRYSAMEDEAFLALRAGDKAKAKQLFTELSQDSATPPGIGARAADMVRYIDD